MIITIVGGRIATSAGTCRTMATSTAFIVITACGNSCGRAGRSCRSVAATRAQLADRDALLTAVLFDPLLDLLLYGHGNARKERGEPVQLRHELIYHLANSHHLDGHTPRNEQRILISRMWARLQN